MFKIGDKVKLKDNSYFSELKGKILTVSNVMELSTIGTLLQFSGLNTFYYPSGIDYFKLVKKRKQPKWMKIWRNI